MHDRTHELLCDLLDGQQPSDGRSMSQAARNGWVKRAFGGTFALTPAGKKAVAKYTAEHK